MIEQARKIGERNFKRGENVEPIWILLSEVFQERAFANPKIDFIWDTVVDSIQGEGKVEGLQLRNVKTGERSSLKVDGAFIAVGLQPNTGYLNRFLKLAPGGFIPVNEQMETEVPGVFATDDIRQGALLGK